MPSFCSTHKIFYRYGECPKCIESRLKQKNYTSSAAVTGRWGQLVANPDLINQDQFGICGVTSAVYLLLRFKVNMAYDLYYGTFAELFPNDQAFKGKKFTTANHQNIKIKFRYLTRRFLAMELDKAPKAAAAAHREMMRGVHGVLPDAGDQWQLASQQRLIQGTNFVDFCLSRALGYVFKETASRRYSGEKAEFNAAFEPLNQDHRKITRIGNLALRSNNLAFVMKEILGAQQVHIARKTGPVAAVPLAPPVAGVSSANFANVAQLALEFQNRLAAPNTFALAAIYADIVNNGHVNAASAQDPTLTYNHWIVINGFNHAVAGGVGGCLNGHVNLNVWTWAQNYNPQICDNHALSYIQDVVFGRF